MTKDQLARLAVCLLPWGLSLVSGCQQQMAAQPRYEPLTPSAFFPDGRSARPLVAGTVARGQLHTDRHLFTGLRTPPLEAGSGPAQQAKKDHAAEYGNAFDTFPFPISAAVLKHGQERYMIFCVVCHDPLGNGQGKIVERGYTPPPSFHIDRLRQAPVGHFFDVITNGYGSMPDYRSQVPPRDRWAIVAYVRALQRSQHASLEDVPAEERSKVLDGGQRP
jgi:mono/diheme cytochrome c family protein